MPNVNLRFPLEKGREGYFAWNTDLKSAIQMSLKLLLFTPKGTRIMFPNYGTDVIKYLFEPLNATLKMKMQMEVATAIRKWIKNIQLSSVNVYFKEDLATSPFSSVIIDDHSVFVVINYTIVSNTQAITIPNQSMGMVVQN